MNYVYPPRGRRGQRGSSIAADIVFVGLVMCAVFAFSIWYTHNVDRMVERGCAAAGDAGCSTFGSAPVSH